MEATINSEQPCLSVLEPLTRSLELCHSSNASKPCLLQSMLGKCHHRSFLSLLHFWVCFWTHIFTLEIFSQSSFFVATSSHTLHCMKSVRIRSFAGLYSVQIWQNTDQKKSEYGHFSRIATHHLERANNKVSFSPSPQLFTLSIQQRRLISKSRYLSTGLISFDIVYYQYYQININTD